MLMKYCIKCGKAIPYPLSYCSDCQAIAEQERAERKKERDKRYDSRRDPKYRKFYNSSEWRLLSSKVIQDAGYRCIWCGDIATEVDHIEEIQTDSGWIKRLDYDNCRALCTACHNKRHGRFQSKNKKTFKGRRGYTPTK